MRIRYVALTLAAGVAASAFVLSAPQARAADYRDGYSDEGYGERDSYDREEYRPERRVHVEERYVEEEPIVEERVVRRAYAPPPVVVVGPGFYGPRRFYGPRYGWRGGYYGHRRWAVRGRW